MNKIDYYTITDAGKNHIDKIISKRPYAEVMLIPSLLNKDFISEEECNSIIQLFAGYAYENVKEFFAQTNVYFKIVENTNPIDKSQLENLDEESSLENV